MASSRNVYVVNPLGTLIVELFRLNGVLLSEGDRLTCDLNLSSARWQVLGAVELAGRALSVSQIARNMGLTRQSVQRIANELSDDGLIEFQENPDHRRSKNVVLTSKGRKAFSAAMRRQAEWGSELLAKAGVTERQLGQAETLLRALRQSISGMKQ